MDPLAPYLLVAMEMPFCIAYMDYRVLMSSGYRGGSGHVDL